MRKTITYIQQIIYAYKIRQGIIQYHNGFGVRAQQSYQFGFAFREKYRRGFFCLTYQRLHPDTGYTLPVYDYNIFLFHLVI